jgi:hypothetical protein
MDPLSLVIGGTIALAGVMVGRLLRPRSQVEQRVGSALPRPQPQPMCGCGHHLVFHDTKTKVCQAQVVIPGRWTGQYTGTYRKCMCQGYRGPLPVEEYIATELTDPDG